MLTEALHGQCESIVQEGKTSVIPAGASDRDIPKFP
jgi:hypothetical protein